MGADAGPLVWSRLAAIIKTGPVKPTRSPRTGGKIAPPLFGGTAPAGIMIVIGADVTQRGVVRINAPRSNGTGLFRGQDQCLGKCRVIGVHAFEVIVKTLHIQGGKNAEVTIVATVHRHRA